MALTVLTAAPEGAEKVLSRDALGVPRDSLPAVQPSARRAARRAGGAPESVRPRGDAGLPPLHQGHPRRRLEGRPDAEGPPEAARGDHRPGGAEDDDQRPQLGRRRLHGRLRGLALALLAERDARPAELHRLRAPDHHPRAGREELPAEREDRGAAGAAPRLAPSGEAPHPGWEADQRQPGRLRALLLPQRPGAAAARAPAPTSTSRRWRATSRRGCGTTCSSPPRRR